MSEHDPSSEGVTASARPPEVATRDGATRVEGPADAASGNDAPPLAPAARLGRYVVVEEVGVGGMGRVYRAYDPKLRREVALKLLHAKGAVNDHAARIEREAQAMARLSHPNLVAVFDVERDHDAVFIAMEFVEGPTLGTWLNAQPRTWQAILEVFTAAARGLAAAHGGGVVHRDFKPSNAIVAIDGRVRVMDFGLARGTGTPSSHTDTASDAASRAPDDSDARTGDLAELTRSGTLLGTPRYMAPEQHRGDPVDAAADQYSYCVALHEALFEQPPFVGADATALLRAKLRGPPAVHANPHQAPRWLVAAIERGLAVRPVDRWPSMHALLAALDRGRARAGTRRLAIGVAVVVLAGGSLAGKVIADRNARAVGCEREGARVETVWNDRARAQLGDAVLASGGKIGPATVEKVMPWLDGFATSWRDNRSSACLASASKPTDAEVDRTAWCFDERLSELDALVDELSQVDKDSVVLAITAAANLSDPQECGDPRFVARLPPPPVESMDKVREIGALLWRARAREAIGRHDEALEIVEEARAAATEIAWPRLVVMADYQRAVVVRRLERFVEAERIGADTYFAAVEIGAWDVAVDTAAELGFLLAARLGRPADGLVWVRHATALVEHAVDRDGVRRARVLSILASTYREAGDYALALTTGEQALALLEANVGTDHPDVGVALHNLAIAHGSQGDHARALELNERALAIYEHSVGPDHLDYASTLANLAIEQFGLGDVPAAIANFERVVEIRKAYPESQRASLGGVLANLGSAYFSLGRLEEAQRQFERALALEESVLGPRNPNIARVLNNLGALAEARDEHDRARDYYERSLEIRSAALGPDHPDVATSLANLADALARDGKHDRARELLRRAIEIRERVHGPSHPEVAIALTILGVSYAATDELAAARPLLERAVTIFEAEGESPGLAEADFVLARVLGAEDHERAVRLAGRARAGFERLADAGRIREIDAWLASQAATSPTKQPSNAGPRGTESPAGATVRPQ